VIVYVETNFVLELALLQEQHESCVALLELCRADRVRLVVPAFSLTEPYGTLTLRKVQRNRTRGELAPVLRELQRTSHYARAVAEMDASLRLLFLDSADDELRRFGTVRDSLTAVAEVVPLDRSVFTAATGYEEQHGLSAQDALVYASVLHHLRDERPARSCFLNRNARDFDDPEIVASLAERGCKMLPRFDSGLDFVRHTIDRA
jgi:predicted nucleic acid-binding protein